MAYFDCASLSIDETMFMFHLSRCSWIRPATVGALCLVLSACGASQAPTTVSPALPPSLPQPLPTPAQAEVVTTARVNIRSGPGLAFDVLAVADPGERFSVLGADTGGDWWEIEYRGESAWISADYVTLAAVHAEDPAITPGPEPLTAPSMPVSPPPPSAPTLPLVQELQVGANVIAFSPDDRLLALGTQDYRVLVYDTRAWQQQWSAVHADLIRGLAFSPDGRVLASTSLDGTARAWDVATGAALQTLDYGAWTAGPDFSADGSLMASGAATGKMVVTNLQDFTPVGEYMNQLPIQALALSPRGPWLAVMTAGSWGPVELAVWDIHTHERRTLASRDGPPNASNPAFSPDTQWLAAAVAPDDPIRVWQTQIWPEVAQLAHPPGWVQQLIFSPDGRRLAALIAGGVENSAVLLWNVPSWEPGPQIRIGDWALGMAFSPDGATLATIHGQGDPPIPPLDEGRLWDATTGDLLARMPHGGQVQGLAFSHDGSTIATSGIDGFTRIWSLANPGN